MRLNTLIEVSQNHDKWQNSTLNTGLCGHSQYSHCTLLPSIVYRLENASGRPDRVCRKLKLIINFVQLFPIDLLWPVVVKVTLNDLQGLASRPYGLSSWKTAALQTSLAWRGLLEDNTPWKECFGREGPNYPHRAPRQPDYKPTWTQLRQQAADLPLSPAQIASPRNHRQIVSFCFKPLSFAAKDN